MVSTDSKHSMFAQVSSLLKDIDRDIFAQFGNNLYCYYLYLKDLYLADQLTRQRLFKTLWPSPDAPPPPLPQLYHAKSDTPPFIEACDVYLQREIYRRIHAAGLEPVDEEPTCGQFAVNLQWKIENIFDLVDSFETQRSSCAGDRITYKDLPLTEKQAERVEQLLPAWDGIAKTRGKSRGTTTSAETSVEPSVEPSTEPEEPQQA